MEKDPEIVITVLIQMHATVTSFDVQASIFENVRLLCKSNGYKPYETNMKNEFFHYIPYMNEVVNEFTRDLTTPTYDVIRSMSGNIIEHVTFNKTLSVDNTPFQGVYLISVHENQRLIYPPPKKYFNLLKIRDLETVATHFNPLVVPMIQQYLIDSSSREPVQQLYLDEEQRVNADPFLSKEEKERIIQDIKNQYYESLQHFSLSLTPDHLKIDTVQLSKMVEIIRMVFGRPSFINLLDYSCSSISRYISNSNMLFKQYVIDEYDIEHGANDRHLGGSGRRRGRRPTRKRRNKKRQLE